MMMKRKVYVNPSNPEDFRYLDELIKKNRIRITHRIINNETFIELPGLDYILSELSSKGFEIYDSLDNLNKKDYDPKKHIEIA